MYNSNDNNKNHTHDTNKFTRINNQRGDRTCNDDGVQIIETRSADNITNYPFGSTITVPHQGQYLVANFSC